MKIKAQLSSARYLRSTHSAECVDRLCLNCSHMNSCWLSGQKAKKSLYSVSRSGGVYSDAGWLLVAIRQSQ